MNQATAIPAAVLVLALVAAPTDPSLAQSRGWQHLDPQETLPVQIGTPLLHAFANAKLTLDQSIAAARHHAGPGKALSVIFKQNGTTPAWAVRYYTDSTLWVGYINAKNGRVIGHPESLPQKGLGDRIATEIAAVRNARISLADAVKKAERNTGAHAINAGIVLPDQHSAYQIAVAAGGRVRILSIDTVSGKMAAGFPRGDKTASGK